MMRPSARSWYAASVFIGSLALALHYYLPQAQVISTSTVISDVTWLPGNFYPQKNTTQIGQENAVIYMLVRNYEVHEALESIRQVEDRFNRRYRYPWVFLNDEEFTDDFKILTSGMVSGKADYGLVPPEMWDRPANINVTHMEERMEEMLKREIPYANSHSYRNMCRFNSGFFFRHELMLPFDWYWRVEPGIKLFCDQLYDPFKLLRENNKVYGFVIALYEYRESIPTLFETSMDFFNLHPELLASGNALDFALDLSAARSVDTPVPDVGGYNGCHFWSNFEIASLKFWRQQAYIDFFDHLDRSGGFYYERWGDAPVHTLGLLALANRSAVHHFSDIGYYHLPFHRCPHDEASYTSGRCLCPPEKNLEADFQQWSCLTRWLKHAGRQHLLRYVEQPH